MKKFSLACVACAVVAVAQEKTPAPPPESAAALNLQRAVRATQTLANINIEMTVYLVNGSQQAQAGGKDELPPDLSATVQQLRGVFSYKSYKLLEAITLRGRNFSGAEVAGDLSDYSHYDFRYRRATLTNETERVIRLDGLHLEITRRHAQRDDVVALVATDLDIKEGQRTVVGKSAVNGTDALFLVIVPKVIE